MNAATVTGVIFVVAGTLAVVSSLQETYEKTFDQTHRGMRDTPGFLVWIVAMCAVGALESVVGRPVRAPPARRPGSVAPVAPLRGRDRGLRGSTTSRRSASTSVGQWVT